MTPCWQEGELRAYLDGELPGNDMQRVAAHLAECAACRELHNELESRAARMQEWLDDAAVVRPVEVYPRRDRPRVLPVRAGLKPAPQAAIVALASAIALAFILFPRHAPRPAFTPAPKPLAAAPSVPVTPAPPQPVAVKPAIIRRHTPVKPRPRIESYVALDTEPIETGIVVRVALGNAQIPADVIFDPEGRPRAIRLVSQIPGDR